MSKYQSRTQNTSLVLVDEVNSTREESAVVMSSLAADGSVEPAWWELLKWVIRQFLVLCHCFGDEQFDDGSEKASDDLLSITDYSL